MIGAWKMLGRPGARGLALALLLAAMAAAAGIALLGLSGWFLTAAAAAGAGGAVAAFNHLLPSAAVRALAIGRVVSRYGEQLVGHEATLTISAALRPLLFERQAAAQVGLASLPAAELSAVTDDVDAVEGGFLKVVAPALGVVAAVLVAVGWVSVVSPSLAIVVVAVFAVVFVVVPARLLHAARRRAALLSLDQVGARADIANAVENAVELDVAGKLGAVAMAGRDRLAQVDAAMDRLQQPFRTAGALAGLAGGWAALMVIAWAAAFRTDAAIAAGAALAVLAAFEAAAASTRILDAASRAAVSASRIAARLQPPRETAPAGALGSALPLALSGVRIAVGDDGVLIGPISLACSAGDIVELGGPSGAGKTTLLECIAFLRPVADGRLAYAGQAQESLRPASVLARVAVAPQFASFLPGALREELAYGQPDASESDILAALQTACMDEVVARRGWAEAASYSGGERRRLGLARALVAAPQLLLLDEPFAGLEPDLVARLKANLVGWVAAGDRAIAFTSHEPGPDWPGHALVRVMVGGRQTRFRTA